jgi:hypothetical protein
MRISYWPESVALNGAKPYNAFLDSLRAAGYELVKEDISADAAVIWSVLWHGRMTANQSVWNAYRANGRPVIVLEVGCIQRGTTWKVGLNGINRSADFGNDSSHDSSRSNSMGLSLKPWNNDGDYILICAQHDKSLQWQDMPPMSRWVMQTIEKLQSYSNRDIVLRPHPRCRLPAIEHQYRGVYRQEPAHLTGTYDDFDLSFESVHAVINWSSNPGVRAIINGVPAFVGPDSLAYDIANHHLQHIEHPKRADRTLWLNNLAWTEYTVEEIAAGLPLSRLRQTLETDIINAMI